MLVGSPSAIITMGLGSWGSTSLVLTLGYGVGEQGATIIGQWSNVITVSAFTGPIIARAETTVRTNG